MIKHICVEVVTSMYNLVYEELCPLVVGLDVHNDIKLNANILVPLSSVATMS